MAKKILFIWNYFYFPWEKGKSRFSDLASAIVGAGYHLEVICSSFYHMGKAQRAENREQTDSLPYRVSFIQEPGYKKNISFRRIFSIRHFNRGVKSCLERHAPVDLVYVPVPSCKTALIARKWCDRIGAKLIIDIEDLWPESFRMLLRPSWLCNVLTAPLRAKANRCYRSGDGLVGVSETFLNRALSVRKDEPPYCVAPIGSDYQYIRELHKTFVSKKPKGEFWITYIGTLGSSYDIRMVMDACESVSCYGHREVVLNILGSGPDETVLKIYAKKLHVSVRFFGLLPYPQMMTILFDSDLGVNPIVKGSVASLINKVGDYAAAGLPVLNSQDCQEYCALLVAYHAGISVPSSDPAAFENALLQILDGEFDLSSMRLGAMRLGEEALSRKAAESRILALLFGFFSRK